LAKDRKTKQGTERATVDAAAQSPAAHIDLSVAESIELVNSYKRALQEQAEPVETVCLLESVPVGHEFRDEWSTQLGHRILRTKGGTWIRIVGVKGAVAEVPREQVKFCFPAK